jgi:hypothetical protein
MSLSALIAEIMSLALAFSPSDRAISAVAAVGWVGTDAAGFSCDAGRR